MQYEDIPDILKNNPDPKRINKRLLKKLIQDPTVNKYNILNKY